MAPAPLSGADIQRQFPTGSDARDLASFLAGNGYRIDNGYRDLLQATQPSASRWGEDLQCYTGRPGGAFAVCFVVQQDNSIAWQPVGIE